jgi:hypothetical protein
MPTREERLAQATCRRKPATGERIDLGKGQQIDIAEEAYVGEPVLEEEEIRRCRESLEGVKTGLKAFRTDDDADAGQLTCQLNRLVTGSSGSEDRSVSGADDADAGSLALVSARENRDVEPLSRQAASDCGDERRLAGTPPVEVTDAENRSWQLGGAGLEPASAEGVGGLIESLPGRIRSHRSGEGSVPAHLAGSVE